MSNRVQKFFYSPSKTVQTDERGTSVQRIIAEYRANGTVPTLNSSAPLYGDFTSSRDLQTKMEDYLAAKEAFDLLPGAVRRAADNNMIRLCEMVEADDDAGRIALHEAGLTFDGWEPPGGAPPGGGEIPPPPQPPVSGPQPPAAVASGPDETS